MRENSADHTVAGGNTFTLSGGVTSRSLMANVFYDFNMGGRRGITPFVGTGVGWSHLDVATKFNANGLSQANGTDNRFAYQLMAGVAVPLGDIVPATRTSIPSATG